ncbi:MULTISPECIES: saccharopine dehydrogenase NADP-binding domain-containing protein [Nocardia]|uniref:saccharopine dehydrogenase NADP-binding domain-containing protein n=1 Tax=Nocardia TaxID=1817 RepID=UPI001F0D642C|nr:MULTISPECIES: saccharopine dehydrogenase NADP-binding domain-containing protein [Nocardia]
MPKIVLFGATGYTGRLTAEALIARGAAPVLAARNATVLGKLAADLGGAETAVSDVTDPASVRLLLGRGDVLVTTVGPFLRYGGPALAAAVAAGAHYFDSTGEGPFIREVFDRDNEARKAGVALLTAFGFDFVPGNLAAGLALREAPEAVRVDIGYFIAGPGTSGGTRASMAGMLFERGFALRGRPGRARADRLTDSHLRRRRSLAHGGIDSRIRTPRTEPRLPAAGGGRRISRTADCGRSRPAGRLVTHRRRRTSGAGETTGRGCAGTCRERIDRRPGAGRTGPHCSWAVAETFDDTGRVLTSVTLGGVDPYDFTAAILGWGAQTALDGGLLGTGALGPVDAFGLDALTAGAANAGFSR